jgi:hypothetical protein
MTLLLFPEAGLVEEYKMVLQLIFKFLCFKIYWPSTTLPRRDDGHLPPSQVPTILLIRDDSHLPPFQPVKTASSSINPHAGSSTNLPFLVWTQATVFVSLPFSFQFQKYSFTFTFTF